MKKLNLKLDSIKEMLGKEQMKKITGGSGCFSGYCGGGVPINYWICFDEYGGGPVGSSCSSVNPFPVGDGELYVYAPANPPYSTVDFSCTVTYCSF